MSSRPTYKVCEACAVGFSAAEANYCPQCGDALVFEADSLKGLLLSSVYTIERKIGGGGMGEVYLAREESENRYVAIKILRANYRDEQSRRVQRFKREAEALTRLTHPNTLRIYAYGKNPEPSFWYIATELQKGVTLEELNRSLLQQGKALSDRWVCDLAWQICASVAHAHAHMPDHEALLHRDLKLNNVMVMPPHGHVKVLDFGLARYLARRGTPITGERFVGTRAYASPEALEGREVGRTSDLYSIGVMLYELFSGELPFPERTGEFRYTAPASLAEVPGPVADLVVALLQLDPDNRPQYARDIQEVLEPLIPPRRLKMLRSGLTEPGVLRIHEEHFVERDDTLSDVGGVELEELVAQSGRRGGMASDTLLEGPGWAGPEGPAYDGDGPETLFAHLGELGEVLEAPSNAIRLSSSFVVEIRRLDDSEEGSDSRIGPEASVVLPSPERRRLVRQPGLFSAPVVAATAVGVLAGMLLMALLQWGS